MIGHFQVASRNRLKLSSICMFVCAHLLFFADSLPPLLRIVHGTQSRTHPHRHALYNHYMPNQLSIMKTILITISLFLAVRLWVGGLNGVKSRHCLATQNAAAIGQGNRKISSGRRIIVIMKICSTSIPWPSS